MFLKKESLAKESDRKSLRTSTSGSPNLTQRESMSSSLAMKKDQLPMFGLQDLQVIESILMTSLWSSQKLETDALSLDGQDLKAFLIMITTLTSATSTTF